MTLSPEAGSQALPPNLAEALSSLTAQGTPNPAPNPLQQILEQQKKAEWAAWLEGEYAKCKNARSIYERQWHINLAFYRGKQYIAPVTVPGAGFRLTAPKSPPWRVRMVINKVRVATRTETSKLTSNKPIPVVVPATNEDEDYAAARVAEQILKAKFNDPDFERVIRKWVWWGSVTGNGFIKSYWNPNEIDESAQSPDQTIDTPFGPMPAPPVRGKICIESVSPFHIYVPDLLNTEIEDQPYIIHVTTKSPIWVEKNFGFKPNVDAKSTASINEAAFVSTQLNQAQLLDAVLVKEVWLKPDAHPDFPEGGMLTVIGGRVVQFQQQWPWPFKEYPFYRFYGIETGEFYTDSVLVDLIPIQKEYNRTKSQMIEIKNLVGKPKGVYAKGSVNPRQITSEPGQWIPYTPGFQPPIILPGVEVPQSMGVELDRLSSDFDDISGQHEITRGNTPAQVTSGTAISFLQEQDDSKLAYQIAGIEYATQKLGTHYLKYVSTYWDQPRIVKVTGKDMDYEAAHWKGSDLKGQTDVRVQAGSALPFSRAAQTAMLTEFMQNGWIAPQDGLELLKFGGFEKVMEDFLVDKRSAQRENMKMGDMDPAQADELVNPPQDPATGQPFMGPAPGPDGKPDPNAEPIPYDGPIDQGGQPWQPQPPLPVNSWDNHEAHIHWHNQFRKTQQFELLEDPVKTMFELHVQAHQMAIMLPQVGASGLPMDPQSLAQQQGLDPASGAPLEEGGQPPGPVPGETQAPSGTGQSGYSG